MRGMHTTEPRTPQRRIAPWSHFVQANHHPRSMASQVRLVFATVAIAFHVGPAAAQVVDDNTAFHSPDPAPRLFQDLACMCAKCDRIRLAECGCPFAAAERQEIMESLRARDLSTVERREAAYREIRDDYVKRFGPGVLSPSAVSPAESLASWIAPLVIALASLGVLIAVVERLRRRTHDLTKRRGPTRRPPAPVRFKRPRRR